MYVWTVTFRHERLDAGRLGVTFTGRLGVTFTRRRLVAETFRRQRLKN